MDGFSSIASGPHHVMERTSLHHSLHGHLFILTSSILQSNLLLSFIHFGTWHTNKKRPQQPVHTLHTVSRAEDTMGEGPCERKSKTIFHPHLSLRRCAKRKNRVQTGFSNSSSEQSCCRVNRELVVGESICLL